MIRRSRKYWPVWCGLAIAAFGAVYLPAVMANRPPLYYALLEFLASAVAIGGGVVAAVVGALWALSPDPTAPPPNTHAEPSNGLSTSNKTTIPFPARRS
jgi:hypothetical protein